MEWTVHFVFVDLYVCQPFPTCVNNIKQFRIAQWHPETPGPN
jgi:hypothetical protein